MPHLGVPATAFCPRCGASNRVGAQRVREGLQPVCGRCAAKLDTPSAVMEVADSGFEEQVLASPLPVLLDVWAPWCVPCRGMEPVIEELAASLSGRVRVAKLNLDRSPRSSARLRIQGVPTLIVFRGGQEIARMIGARGRSELLRTLADLD
jgi:thioredoxin 2